MKNNVIEMHFLGCFVFAHGEKYYLCSAVEK